MARFEVLDPMTQSSRGLRPFRNRCLRTIAPGTKTKVERVVEARTVDDLAGAFEKS